MDSGSHCLRKPSSWANEIRIKPRHKAWALQQLTYLKEFGNKDEILVAHNR